MSSGDAWWLRGAARPVQPRRRTGMCGAWIAPHAQNGASLVLTKTGAKWKGIAMCGHIWDCPACAATLKAERRTDIEGAIRHIGGTWVMLTLTVRHHQGMRLADSLHVVKEAWRRTRKQRSVATWFSENVKATITSTEITVGPAGWHPHLHILLAVKSENAADIIRETLEDEWLAAVDNEARGLTEWHAAPAKHAGDLVPPLRVPPRVDAPGATVAREYAPARGIGVHWSRPRDCKDATQAALYAAKMALEASGEGKTSVTPFQLLKDLALSHRAGAFDARAHRLWGEYVEATRGKRCIELDDRAKRAARKHAGAIPPLPFGTEGTSDTDFVATEPDTANVTRDDFRRIRALERVFPHLLRLVCESARTLGSARAALDYWMSDVPRAEYIQGMRPNWMSRAG